MEKGYTATIGLEIHAHLKTTTKMFSRSPNNPDETQPNVNISPIDVAHPGTLPVINKKAVEHMVRIGLAVDGGIADFTEFDRKNYFYPDIPKGYQISQYKYPIVSGGSLAGFELTRIHLEEDTATSKHHDGYSDVDFNRAGAPLMELVTEPVLHTPEDVMKFARELQLLLRYLGASDANIEKGQMRVEVNLSVSKTDKLGTKVEVKNIGSITAAAKATAYEINRQIEVLESGGELIQETRGWHDAKEITFSQRSKENAQDYRYFPEPDLPKLYLHEIFDLEAMKSELPELPQAKRDRYASEYGIKEEDIETYIADRELADFFEATVAAVTDKNSIAKISNYLTSDVAGIAKGDEYKEKSVFEHMTPASFAKMIDMLAAGDLSSRGAKDILLEMIQNGGDPKKIAEEKGLIQENDVEALKVMVQKIIDDNPEQVVEYRNGKETMINYFVGQAMKASRGAGNPQVFTQLFKEIL
jgi:aspartyl-tRNA(Asn)/glutamyl-tRNA(Gln) amidotransferase subunit B